MTIADLKMKVALNPRSSNQRRDLAAKLLTKGFFLEALEQAQIGLDLQDDELSPVAVELEELERTILERHLDALVGPAFEFVIDNHLPKVENGRVVELSVHVEGDDLRRVAEVFTSPLLSSLQVLGVIVDDIVEDVIAKLDMAPFALRELNLWLRGNLSPMTLKSVLEAPVCGGLESLYLRGTQLTDDTVKALGRSAATITELTLRSDDMTRLGPNSVNHLADARFTPSLTALGLISTSIGDQGAFNLASLQPFANLRRLALRDGVITNDGAKILGSDPVFEGLEFLDVSRNVIDDAGLVALRGLGIQVRSEGQHPSR
ncbi:MAG: hypothetical protein AUK47_10120 [Deltaproteobacteria bacterium CG2_30_63_29]|nr:MAG: hypothetical protein AUK47_10120 [Deltaproteobacteria bacterium CG2_30_63_29]PIW02264.1 MAG: hypothetical protein COW42_02335 [Deltaproteobacteria bacterium CG17_big_fil_post_rev_8_21_14_2_50_63_7]PJB42466.1 MAG: hypothetical protein CO108_11600 [Deltaproteobacteria bacterium CG_4_9_14_3_um_filter_63_12]